MMPWEEYAAAGYGNKPAKADPKAARAQFAAAASAATGIPEAAILAHTALETGADASKTVGAYNYGNIKAGSKWQGDTASVNALEYDKSGGTYREPSKFRSYSDPERAAQDYAALIRSRYPQAAQARTVEEFAQGLKAGGYATDPDYVRKLVSVAGRRVGTEKGRATNRGTAETSPAKMPWEEYAAAGYRPDQTAAKPDRSLAGLAGDLAAGAIRGAGSIGATLLSPLDYAARKPVNLMIPGTDVGFEFGGDRRQGMADALGTLGADTGSNSFAVGKVGGELAGTLGVGGGLARGMAAAAPMLAARVMPLLASVETGGMSSGSVGGISGLGLRAAGGAAAGAAAAGMAGGDDQDAAQAAFLGGMLPVGFGAAGKAAALATGIVKPFTGAGQDRIVGDILRRYAHDPAAAAEALTRYRQVVQGSVPLTSAAAGDVGLAGLTRTMQAVNPQTANEIAMRGTAQNAARTAALEQVAGTPAAIDLAKDARRLATTPMREGVLQRAGQIDGREILGQLDDLIRNPSNAGSTNRQALDRVRQQVLQSTDEAGGIDARALYEIRKDIGLAMQGKLQGDAGNLRHARGVLDGVQSMFDDAIGGASARAVGPVPAGKAADPWRDYLSTFARQSGPVNQMEALQDALKRVQTGTTDMQGTPVISAAKLNNLIKNEGDDLKRVLTPDQLQRLREVAADANAARLGLEAGKSVGSNTVQNLSQSWLLQRVFGELGESPMVSSIMRKPLGLIYGGANEQITDRLSRALLDPEYARQLIGTPARRGGGTSGGAPLLLTGGGDARSTTGPRRGLLD